jgi:hypothetical protein
MPAKAKQETVSNEPIRDVSADESWEFETVVEESPTVIIFDKIGDQFVGQYRGRETVSFETLDAETKQMKTETFDRFTFRARDKQLYAINSSFQLEQGMEKVMEGDWARITYTKDIPTKRGLNPLKDFRIEVRKS